MKTTANIHPHNEAAIKSLVQDDIPHSSIHGQRLAALHRLIQIKGQPITSEDYLNGHRAMKLPSGDMIAIIHNPARPGNFFPCQIKSVILSELTTP
jgi:hypothetical protein